MGLNHVGKVVLSCFAYFPLFGLSDSAISLVSRSSSFLAAYP
ncbi:hypothetical protein MUK42_36220 [Musa troglodytarum]|uniref:Uncharacterized protein n=1 Tax=Musa troglodytarum TaxID=320322 RepID=A0A9E7JYD1_9LILI|nr:hypothetical protein MUK42_36220 [Musa troglodytarum]